MAHDRRRLLLVFLAGASYFAMAMRGASHESGTYDEFVHVTAGYSYSALGDYRLNSENGNLPQRLMALPLLADGHGFPSLDQPAWQTSNMWDLSDQFFFGSGRDADRSLMRSRAMIALVGALLVALVFAWSFSLFGETGAWVSTAIAVFSPALLAHGALATSDLTGAAFFAAAVFCLWRVLNAPSTWWVAASSVATAGLFLSKLSAPLIIPVALGMLAVRLSRRPRPSARSVTGIAMLHVVVVVTLIWAAYGFRYTAFGAHTTPTDTFNDSWSDVLETPGIVSDVVAWGREHRVLPEAYLYGIATVNAYSKHRASFLNGRVSIGGSHWYFPYAALVKTTLPELALIVLLPIMLARRRRDDSLYDTAPLFIFIAVYFAAAVAGSLDIGYRHLLPILPAIAVLLGATALPLARVIRGQRDTRTLAAASLVGLLVIAHAAESLRASPNYLAYFNQLDGGPKKAYEHLVDSSLDWGQDLPALKQWLDREGLQSSGHAPVYLSYFGTALPAYYGIDALHLPFVRDRWTPHEPAPLTPGIYCISATMLQGVYLMPQGSWATYETDYRSMIDNLRLYDSTGVNPATRAALIRQTGEDFWPKMFYAFEQYRFARLAAYLRKRAPDAEVGYSILVYRVGEEELRRALYGAVP